MHLLYCLIRFEKLWKYSTRVFYGNVWKCSTIMQTFTCLWKCSTKVLQTFTCLIGFNQLISLFYQFIIQFKARNFFCFRSLFLLTALRLTEKFVILYSDLPVFDQVFSPLSKISNLIQEHYKDFTSLNLRLKRIKSLIKENSNKPKVRLSLGPVRPRLLKLHSLKYEPP